MSQENVDTVKRIYERFARTGGSDPADLARDWEWVIDRRIIDTGTYRGKEAGRWLGDWVQSFDGFVMEPDEFLDAGDKVVALVRQRARVHGADVAVAGEWWTVHTLRDGKVVRIESYGTRAEALEAVGLRE